MGVRVEEAMRLPAEKQAVAGVRALATASHHDHTSVAPCSSASLSHLVALSVLLRPRLCVQVARQGGPIMMDPTIAHTNKPMPAFAHPLDFRTRAVGSDRPSFNAARRVFSAA